MTYKVNKSISAKENLYALIQYTWPEYADILNEDNITLTRGEVTDPVTGTTSLTISASSSRVTGNKEVTYTVANLENLLVGELIALDAADAVQLVSTIVNNDIPCLPSEIVVGDLISTDGGWTISLSATEDALTVTGSTELSIVEESETEGPGFGEHLILRSQGDIDFRAPVGSILHSIDGGETWNENTEDYFTLSLPSEVVSAVYLKSNDDVELTISLQVNNTTTNTDNFRGVESWWESPRSIQLNVRDNSFYVPKVAPPNITNMSHMFSSADIFNGDISQWDVSKVTEMRYMFNDAHAFNSDISNWNVSNVARISSMFTGAHAFNSDISQWDISKVTELDMMFYNAHAFNSDISNWNVSNVNRMSSMFTGAHAFNSDISQWDVSKVEDMSGMFKNASAFNSDISNWDVSKVEYMSWMFDNATSFNRDLSSWCVSRFPSKPNEFDINASAWTLPRPVWGTCPPR